MAYIGKTPTPVPLTSSDITDAIITNAKLAQDIISAETELATAPASTDELLISDDGVLKRIDVSLVGGNNTPAWFATKTSHQSVSDSTFTDVTGWFVNITPKFNNSKIIWRTDITSNINDFAPKFCRILQFF